MHLPVVPLFSGFVVHPSGIFGTWVDLSNVGNKPSTKHRAPRTPDGMDWARGIVNLWCKKVQKGKRNWENQVMFFCKCLVIGRLWKGNKCRDGLLCDIRIGWGIGIFP